MLRPTDALVKQKLFNVAGMDALANRPERGTKGRGRGGAGPYFECGMCLSLCERLLQSCSYSCVPSGSLGLLLLREGVPFESGTCMADIHLCCESRV